jgi:hypothetical protein
LFVSDFPLILLYCFFQSMQSPCPSHIPWSDYKSGVNSLVFTSSITFGWQTVHQRKLPLKGLTRHNDENRVKHVGETMTRVHLLPKNHSGFFPFCFHCSNNKK